VLSFVLAGLLLVTFPSRQSPAPAPPDQKAHAAALLASIAAGDFAKVEAEFDDKMKAALPPGRLAGGWASLVLQAGAFQKCASEPRVVTIAGKTMVITACTFERSGVDVQFAFDADSRISGLAFRPAAPAGTPYVAPSYVTAAAYTDTETTVGSGEWVLPGTLSLPNGQGPFPAVVLVAGSGPNDRDETVGASKPFRDLAGGLATRGIAVLRYDKRTKVHGARLAGTPGFTVRQEVVDDVLEAVKVLRAHPKIDRARVYVAGHSLGAMLIPRIAAADPTLAGLIVMAGPARSLEQAVLEQTRYLALADGTISAAEQSQIDAAAALVAQVQALTAADATSTAPIFGAPASYWLDLRGYDPPAAARSIKAPMLVMQGGRDYQVTMAEFEKWKAALAGRADVTYHTYAALNHLFIAGSGKSLPAEYQVAGHVSELVVADIAAWILGSGAAR
jgi:dienelactone hydrolase